MTPAAADRRTGFASRRRTRSGTTRDRGEAGGCTRASCLPGRPSCPPWREAFRPGHPEQLREAPRFGLRHGRAERRDPVVTPPFIVVFGFGAIAGFDQQSLVEH